MTDDAFSSAAQQSVFQPGIAWVEMTIRSAFSAAPHPQFHGESGPDGRVSWPHCTWNSLTDLPGLWLEEARVRIAHLLLSLCEKFGGVRKEHYHCQ